MKLLFTLLLVTASFATTITLKDGSSYSGQLICQKRTTITLKTPEGTLSLGVRTIATIDSTSYEGAKKLVLPQGVLDPRRNEIAYINYSIDSITIRLRDSSDTMVDEKSGAPGDTLIFIVDNGIFYETVQFHRGDLTYYLKGQKFNVTAPCNSFQKLEISLKGSPKGVKPPQLKSLKNLFDLP